MVNSGDDRKLPRRPTLQSVMNENSTITEMVQTLVNGLNQPEVPIPGLMKAINASFLRGLPHVKELQDAMEDLKNLFSTPELRTDFLFSAVVRNPCLFKPYVVSDLSFEKRHENVLDLLRLQLENHRWTEDDDISVKTLDWLRYFYRYVAHSFMMTEPVDYNKYTLIKFSDEDAYILTQGEEVGRPVDVKNAVAKAVVIVKEDKIALADYYFYPMRSDGIQYPEFKIVDFYHLNLDRELMHHDLTKHIASLRSIVNFGKTEDKAYQLLMAVQTALEEIKIKLQ